MCLPQPSERLWSCSEALDGNSFPSAVDVTRQGAFVMSASAGYFRKRRQTWTRSERSNMSWLGNDTLAQELTQQASPVVKLRETSCLRMAEEDLKFAPTQPQVGSKTGSQPRDFMLSRRWFGSRQGSCRTPNPCTLARDIHGRWKRIAVDSSVSVRPLLLELKSEGELRLRNRIPQQRKQDSFYVEECRTILDRDSQAVRTPNRERSADSDLEPMKQRHRRAVSDGGRKSARIRSRKQNHICDVKVCGEVVDAVARDGRLRAAGTEGST